MDNKLKATDASPSNINALSAILSGSPSGAPQYEAVALARGLERESVRLGSHQFLVVVYQSVYDCDGLTDYAYLLESFDGQPDAQAYAENLKCSLMQRQLGPNESSHLTWELESEGEIWTLPSPQPSTSLLAVFDRTYKLRAGPFDTKYTCIRVIGSFTGQIVDVPLFEFINARHELWSFFVDVGRSEAGHGSYPVPY